MMTLAALAVLGTNVVSATSEPVKELSVNINGIAIEQAAIFDKQQQTVLVPLRPVAESLGFAVAWNDQIKAAEVQKGAISSYAKAGEDRYPYAKMYKTLGAEPRLLNGTTYVPVAFVDEILQAEVNVSDSAVTVVDEETQKTGNITSINKSEDGRLSILIGDFQSGVILNLTEDTKITDAAGKELKAEDLKTGMEVEATHHLFMTASMPPQTSALSIVVKDSQQTGEAEKAPVRTGTITSINKSEDGKMSILINGYQSGIMLHLSGETKITDAAGKELKAEDLKLGMEVEATHPQFMTMSLPPQTSALTIVVKGSLESQEVIGTAGKVVSMEPGQEGTYKMLVEGQGLTQTSPEKVALIITDKTVIVSAKDNKVLKPEELKADMKVFAFYGPMLTRSLPPIGTAEKIVVEVE